MKNIIEVNYMLDNKTNLFAAMANTSAGVTVSSGFFHYINDNATVITVFLGIFGFLLTLIFGYLNNKEHRKKTQIMEAQLMLNQEERELEMLDREKESKKEDKIIITDKHLIKRL